MTLFDRVQKLPLAIKTLIVAIITFQATMWFDSLKINEHNQRKQDYETEISSIVVKSNSFHGRSVEFHLENGAKIYFMPPIGNKIMIGDSVRKGSNTYLYNLFRKDENGDYKFLATYNIIDAN